MENVCKFCFGNFQPMQVCVNHFFLSVWTCYKWNSNRNQELITFMTLRWLLVIYQQVNQVGPKEIQTGNMDWFISFHQF